MKLTKKQFEELQESVTKIQAILTEVTYTSPMQLTAEDIQGGGWYLNNPTLEHWKAFIAKGLEVHWDREAWDSGRVFAEWYGGEVYPTGALDQKSVLEIKLIDSEFYYTGVALR